MRKITKKKGIKTVGDLLRDLQKLKEHPGAELVFDWQDAPSGGIAIEKVTLNEDGNSCTITIKSVGFPPEESFMDRA